MPYKGPPLTQHSIRDRSRRVCHRRGKAWTGRKHETDDGSHHQHEIGNQREMEPATDSTDTDISRLDDSLRHLHDTLTPRALARRASNRHRIGDSGRESQQGQDSQDGSEHASCLLVGDEGCNERKREGGCDG